MTNPVTKNQCFYFTFWASVTFIVFHTGESNINDDTRQLCTLHKTCTKCITANVLCSWCYDNLYANPRCDHQKFHLIQGCNETKILNPSHKINLIQNDPLSDTDTSKILIKPQKIRLQIRPHENATIPIKFYSTKDHAVDMYFLMDLSYTMNEHIKELSQVTMELVQNIRNLTGSLHVGFGLFVDKILLPFGYCPPKVGDCGHSFMQKMNLTNNFKLFQKDISNLTMLRYNLDSPEGGLDALMQAVVCKEQIGWRKNSRKIIIYCSDGPFHFAGDGRIGGFILPNDGKCHMENNVYTQEYLQDYPSVEQISQTIQKQNVTVIFAVGGQEYQPLYQTLSQRLASSYASELSKDSTIAQIVSDGYKNITSKVEMKTNNPSFQIDFFANCSTGKWVDLKECNRLKLGEIINLKAVIRGPKCSQGNQNELHQIKIYPLNSDTQMEVEVQLICKCECEQKEVNSPMCNKNGMLHCGDCVCNEGFSGEKCECDQTKRETTKENCRPSNDTVEDCNGRGSCECGRCVCYRMASNRNHYYSGTYCECDDHSCPNYNGNPCGGPSHGVCECGLCKCRSGFTGIDCQCPTSQENCRSKNTKICNGHGECECGVCICDKSSGFIGDTCDNCPTCNNWCEINKECVKCMVPTDKKGGLIECKRLCKIDEISMVDKMAEIYSAEDVFPVCKVEIDKCIHRYQTIIQNGTERILILKKKECPESKTTALVIGIVSGILLLGLLILIIWKIVTTIFDRRELARFNEEKANATWTCQTNPLFIQSSTTYENPTWILNG